MTTQYPQFRVSLRRTPPVWYENRLMEVAEDLSFDALRITVNLGANRVIALTISTGEDKETKLWVGTACGLSCYTY